MKIKELIRKLKDFDENLEVAFSDGSIFSKEPEIVRGDIELVGDAILVNYCKLHENNKGRFLIISTENSDYYSDKDFPRL